MRDKWLEKVEFSAGETNEGNKEPNKLIMWNGGNGDLYIGIAPQSHRSCYSHYLRIERSGGASTRNPRLVKALTEAYDAIAGNEDTSPTEKLRECYQAMEDLIEGRRDEDREAVQKAFEKMQELVKFKCI